MFIKIIIYLANCYLVRSIFDVHLISLTMLLYSYITCTNYILWILIIQKPIQCAHKLSARIRNVHRIHDIPS